MNLNITKCILIADIKFNNIVLALDRSKNLEQCLSLLCLKWYTLGVNSNTQQSDIAVFLLYWDEELNSLLETNPTKQYEKVKSKSFPNFNICCKKVKSKSFPNCNMVARKSSYCASIILRSCQTWIYQNFILREIKSFLPNPKIEKTCMYIVFIYINFFSFSNSPYFKQWV